MSGNANYYRMKFIDAEEHIATLEAELLQAKKVRDADLGAWTAWAQQQNVDLEAERDKLQQKVEDAEWGYEADIDTLGRAHGEGVYRVVGPNLQTYEGDDLWSAIRAAREASQEGEPK